MWLVDVAHGSLVLIGLVAGVIGGLLGIGGSVVMIPGMTLVFGTDQHLYQGAAMIVNFFVVGPAVVQHFRARAVVTPIVRMTIPSAIVGVVAGVWLSAGPWFQGENQLYLARLFGAFLFYVAGYNVYRLLLTPALPDMDDARARTLGGWRIALAVGLPTGLIGGLLGIGGGAIAVPLQQVILRVPLRRAIANSAVTILPLSLVGATYKNYCNAQAGIPFAGAATLAAFLIPTAIAGGFLGGQLVHRAPRRMLRVAFILLMLYAGFALLQRTVNVPAAATRPVSRSSCAVGFCSAVLPNRSAQSWCSFGAKPADRSLWTWRMDAENVNGSHPARRRYV